MTGGDSGIDRVFSLFLIADWGSTDALTDSLRRGAGAWLRTAVEAEVSEFLSRHAEPVDDQGRRLVRHGHQPERDVMTGIGKVPVRVRQGP